MNWFNKFFGAKHVDAKPQTKVDMAHPGAVTESAQALPAQGRCESIRNEAHLSPEQLREFVPLRDLDEAILVTLSHATLKYAKDAVLFQINEPCERLHYLMKGILQVQPAGQYGYLIGDHTVRSRLPLNTGHFYSATIQAVTEVELLEIPAEFNRLWLAHRDDENFIELLEITLPDTLPHKAVFESCVDAYRNHHLSLPSLPDVAFKLNQSMHRDISIKETVEILHLDPRIVAKVIQVANSPIYATGVNVSSCQAAVARLGLPATRNLVMSISMKELFHSSDPELTKAMRLLWKNCVYRASLCFVLAQECGEVLPEDAMLAGLLADIGEIPVIQFIDQQSCAENRPGFAEIQEVLPYFRAPVGVQLLRNLGLAAELSAIPLHAEDWYYDSGARMNLIDIVILAKLHSYFGSGHGLDLPYINTIPAYSKLPNGTLTPDLSLSVLHDAHARIREAMQLLA